MFHLHTLSPFHLCYHSLLPLTVLFLLFSLFPFELRVPSLSYALLLFGLLGLRSLLELVGYSSIGDVTMGGCLVVELEVLSWTFILDFLCFLELVHSFWVCFFLLYSWYLLGLVMSSRTCGFFSGLLCLRGLFSSSWTCYFFVGLCLLLGSLVPYCAFHVFLASR